MSKVILHHLNGSTYTFTNSMVDRVHWEKSFMWLTTDGEYTEKVEIDSDVIAIQDICEGDIIIHKNPAFGLSIHVDITTAKQRMRQGRLDREMWDEIEGEDDLHPDVMRVFEEVKHLI